MEAWQALRLKRATEQYISVTRLDIIEHAFVFHVQGMSDEYLVEISDDVEDWPPQCNCEDQYWRPGLLCKHIILCLALMGADERDLQDCDWKPRQHELWNILSNAPDCVCGTLAKNHGIKKHTACN